MIIRIALFLLALTACAQAQSEIPALRDNVLVSGDLVRIGDLVDHAGEKAGIAIFRAPDPGHTGRVPASRVIESLRAQEIVVLDTRGITEIAITRASRAVEAKEIEKHLVEALGSRINLSDPGNLRLGFERDFPAIHVDANADPKIHVARLAYEPRSGRFEAEIEINGAAKPLRLGGIATETRNVAVATRKIARGEILQESDIAIERRAKSDVGGDTVSDRAAAIGLAARQMIGAGQIVHTAYLMRPELVHRNQPVIMTVEQPGLSLSLRGKALESGAEGDVVNVVNLQSKRVLQGIVSGEGRVTIAAMMPPATTKSATNSHAAETPEQETPK